MKTLLPAILMSLCLSAAHGEFTYVDATPTNTTVNGAAIVLAPDGRFNVDTANNGTDNLWSYRSGTFEGGFYFETDSQPNTDETTDPLVTTITLPVAGTYDIVVVNGANVSPRDIAIKSGSAPTSGVAAEIFLSTEVLSADQAANPPLVDFDATFTNARTSSGRAAYLGKVTTTSANETIQVYINGYAATTVTATSSQSLPNLFLRVKVTQD